MTTIGAIDRTHRENELQAATAAGVAFATCLTRDFVPTPHLRALSFECLPAAAAREWDALKRIQVYPARTTICSQGQEIGGVLQIRRGAIKLSTISSKGRAVILRIAKEGEFIGWAEALSAEPSIATAETLEETELARVDNEPFLQFLYRHPAAAISVAYQAALNYKSACKQINLLGLCRSAKERIAQFLLNWTAPAADPQTKSLPVWVGLTHEEISQIAGTTRETVTRTLISFKKCGSASLADSRLVIHDRPSLEKLVT